MEQREDVQVTWREIVAIMAWKKRDLGVDLVLPSLRLLEQMDFKDRILGPEWTQEGFIFDSRTGKVYRKPKPGARASACLGLSINFIYSVQKE